VLLERQGEQTKASRLPETRMVSVKGNIFVLYHFHVDPFVGYRPTHHTTELHASLCLQAFGVIQKTSHLYCEILCNWRCSDNLLDYVAEFQSR
jgi:hypothetical protein